MDSQPAVESEDDADIGDVTVVVWFSRFEACPPIRRSDEQEEHGEFRMAPGVGMNPARAVGSHGPDATKPQLLSSICRLTWQPRGRGDKACFLRTDSRSRIRFAKKRSNEGWPELPVPSGTEKLPPLVATARNLWSQHGSGMDSNTAVGSCSKALDEVVARVPAGSNDPAGQDSNPLRPCTPNRQSSVSQRSVQNGSTK